MALNLPQNVLYLLIFLFRWRMGEEHSLNGIRVARLKDMVRWPRCLVINDSIFTGEMKTTSTVNGMYVNSHTMATLSDNQTFKNPLKIKGLNVRISKMKIKSGYLNDVSLEPLETVDLDMRMFGGLRKQLQVYLGHFQHLQNNSIIVTRVLKNNAIMFTGWEFVHKLHASQTQVLDESFNKLAVFSFITSQYFKLGIHNKQRRSWKKFGKNLY